MVGPERVSPEGESPVRYAMSCPTCGKRFEYRVFPHQLAMFGDDFIRQMGYEGMRRAGCDCDQSEAEKARHKWVREAVAAFVGADDGDEEEGEDAPQDQG